MPGLDPVVFLSPSSIGTAIEVTVVSLASPTELNSRAASQGDLVITRTVAAGTDDCVVYYADTTSDAQSLPYIVSSATAGCMWVAVAGRYVNGEVTASTGFTGPHMRAPSSAGLLLENSNGDDVALLGAGPGTGTTFYGGVILDAETASRIVATGASKDLDTPSAVATDQSLSLTNSSGITTQRAATQDAMRLLGRAGGTSTYIGTLTPTTLTASRTYTFPDAAIVVAGSAAAMTSGGVPIITTGGLLLYDSQLLFDDANKCLSVGTGFVTTTAQSSLRVVRTFTDTQCNAIDTRANYTPAAGNGNQSRAFGMALTINASAGALTVTIGAPNASMRSDAAVSAGNVTGLAGYTCTLTNSGAGTVSDLAGYHVQSGVNSGGGTITNIYGMRIESQSVGTNRYGINIQNISGGTLNYAILTNAGIVSIGDTTDATSASTGGFQTASGANIAKNLLARQGSGKGLTSTATAAGTTTLTNASTQIQIFTGTTTQTLQLPAANLFGSNIGVEYIVINRSTGTVTAQRAGSDTFDGGGTTDAILTNTTRHYISNGSNQWHTIT